MDVQGCVVFSAGVLIRLMLLCFGVYQDQNLQVKYTDVDYHVFTDASKFITQGHSPYNRSTFRYTPLLALILTPNILVTSYFGKILFVGCDVLCGLLIFRLSSLRGVSRSSAWVYCGLWLFNPLPIGVSTRGNAESLLAVLVLSTLLCLECKRLPSAALLFGLSVHMKIYPVTYALPIALSLWKPASRRRGVMRTVLAGFSGDLLLFAAVSGSLFFALSLRLGFRARVVSVPRDPQRHTSQLLSVFLHVVRDVRAQLERRSRVALFPAAASAAARFVADVSLGSSLLLFPSHRRVCQLQQSVHIPVFSLVSVFAAAGLATFDLQRETRRRASALVVCGTGSLVGSSILFGVRGLECFRSRLDRRSDVSPHQLSHSGSDRLPLQTSRRAAKENPLKV